MMTTEPDATNEDTGAAVEDARRAVLDEIGSCYGGAFGVAWVHGWRFKGEVTKDDWPVALIDSLDAYAAEIRADERRQMPCVMRYKDYGEADGGVLLVSTRADCGQCPTCEARE